MPTTAPAPRTAPPAPDHWVRSSDAGRGSTLQPVAYAGCGTYSEVWQVRDTRTGTLFALKQLLPEWEEQRITRRLLENEAAIGLKVHSEFVVRVIDTQLEQSPRFILLEWLTGQSLEKLLEQTGRLPCLQAVWIARQCAQGIRDLRQAGYLHGDIKPANLFVAEDGQVKLIDLGFAQPDPQSRPADFSMATITGTPAYLAPEALSPSHPQGVDKDLYSLGITLYQMLAGRTPFMAETSTEILQQQQRAIPPRLRAQAPDVPRELEELVETLLAKQSLRRGQGVDWLVHRLLGLELALFSQR